MKLVSRVVLVVGAIVVGSCSPPSGVLLNAPPQLDQATVVIDGHAVGQLKTSVYYKWVGFRRMKQEFGAPPRYEANLEIRQLATGKHSIRILRSGFEQYRATFKYPGGQLELYIPEEAGRKLPARSN